MKILTFIIVTLLTKCQSSPTTSVSSLTQSSNCNLNEVYYDGKCYDFVNATSPVSYASAQEWCRSTGKTLAKIPSAGVQSFLANSAEMRAWNRALFGLQLTRDKWTWAKDGSLLQGQGCYVDNTEKRDLNISTQFMYSLKTADCIDYCRTQPTVRFAGVQAGRQCLCGSNYGTLSPTSNCNTPCGGDPNSFCGGQGANYIYAIDGANSVWEDGRPANDGGCGALVVGKLALFPWRDVQCSTKLAHICQFGEYRDLSEVSAYFCLFTTCYALYELQKPWYSARAHCKMLGGDLVKIDTVKVHTEIVAMLSDHLYLGLVWIGTSRGKWVWSDGSSLGEYTAWSSYNSQPVVVDSSTGSIICAELSSSETNYNWVVRDCGQIAGKTTFICERTSTAAVVLRNSNKNGDELHAIEAASAPVVANQQQQQQKEISESGVSYGVSWYGWLLIGIMIGVVVCVVVFTLVWAFCMRKPIGSSKVTKLGSATSGTRSASKTHVCQRHGATSSGVGSSVNSTSSSGRQAVGPNSVAEKQRMVDETVMMTTTINENGSNHHSANGRPFSHEYRDGVTTVSMGPNSANRVRVNSGRSASETRLPNESRISSAGEREDQVPEIASAGRRRTRKRSESRVAPAQSDPFSISQDLEY